MKTNPTPQPITVQKAVTIVSGGNIGIGVTKPSQKEWSIALEKQIILSIVTAWELGKKQKLTPTRYNLDTKKLGEPIFNLVQLQLAQTRTEERNKVIEVAIKAAKQYQIDQLVGSAIPIVVNEAFYKQLLNYDLDKLNQLKGEK